MCTCCLDSLLSWARNCDIQADDLDMLVHDLKGDEAAEINNGGLESQLEYVLKCSSGHTEVAKLMLLEYCRKKGDVV